MHKLIRLMLSILLGLFHLSACAIVPYGRQPEKDSKPSKPTELLNGIHMRISIYMQMPLLTVVQWPTENTSFVVKGLYTEIIFDMIKRYNMTYEFVAVDLEKWLNNSFASLMDQLLNDEADFVPYPFPRTLENSKKMFLGASAYIDQFYFLQPHPLEESRLTAPVSPFQIQTWFIFILSTIVFIVILSLMSIHYSWKKSMKISIVKITYKNWEYVVTILFAQGNTSPVSKNFSLRFMVGIWLLMMVVVINAYTGTLTSFLTSPKFEPTIDTFEQLVERRKKLTVFKGLLDDVFLNATSGVLKTIGDGFRENPDLMFSDYRIANNNIAKRGYIYCGPGLHARSMMSNIAKISGGDKCVAVLGKKPLPLWRDSALAMNKAWPYKKILDDNYLLRLWDSGLTFYYIEKYFSKVHKCDAQTRRITDPFTLRNFSGVFAMMIIGLTMSFLIFVVELFSGRILK